MSNNNAIETTATTEARKIPTLDVFGTIPVGSIIVPEMPMSARNNCQAGQWAIGDEDKGNKLAMTIVKFTRFFGDLGQTKRVPWGQIWFIADAGDLPLNTVMVTYIKGRSLEAFSRKITEIQTLGVEPARGIFVPDFIKHSGNKPDEHGVLRPTNYYSLKWDWYPRGQKIANPSTPLLKELDALMPKSMARLEEIAEVLSEPDKQSKLVDMRGTHRMQDLTHLTPQEVAALMEIAQGEASPSQSALSGSMPF